MRSTLKGFGKRGTLSGFYSILCLVIPGLSLRSNPGLKLANAFGVLKLSQKSYLSAVSRRDTETARVTRATLSFERNGAGARSDAVRQPEHNLRER